MRSKFLFGLLFSLISCVGHEYGADEQNNDKFEDFNREIFDANMAIDGGVLRPVASGYKELPEVVQKTVGNFTSNLKAPFSLVNYAISGNFEKACITFIRFVVNSTVGVFGIFDVASNDGVKVDHFDYDDAMNDLEIPSGPYVVLPLRGSSTLRDTVLYPISWLFDPLSYTISLPLALCNVALRAVDSRAKNMEMIDKMKENAIDPYALSKSVHMQKYEFPKINQLY